MANESQKMKSILRDAGIALALLVLILVFALTTKNFLAPSNITNILTQVTINLILATGMTFVILIGGIDLSVGSILALCAVVGGTVMNLSGLDVVSAVLLATVVSILVGIACGMANGLISAYWGIPPFIVTLGMLNVARGAALQFTDARPIYSFPPELINFGDMALSFHYFSIPLVFIVALILVFVAWFILTKTVFGRMLYAIGNNEEAVRLAGHPVFWYKVAAFTIAGGTVGIGAIIYIARLSVASPIIGVGFELNAIAAVIIGGTSLNGGRGSVFGTLVGAIIIGVLANGLVLLGLGDFIRQMITGLVIILAVVLDKYRERLAS
ncbi:ABC transporter permease [Bartonella sp. HY038]|uniref:ABC transporter permease n=1 Tax=Bartonella sp. HY038 TaxID=2759660 RepID=UPI0015FE3483|nr:ABC transporter permease [Bartonella sp. HY038]